MTLSRGAGRAGERRFFSAAVPIVLIVLAALIGAGCADGRSTTVSPSISPSAGASGSPDASGGPKATPWPGNAVLGIEALGAADGPIVAALSDLGRGIQTEDLVLIRRAADGLAGLDVLLPNIDKINIYPPLVPFSERYDAAIRGIVTAAKATRDAIDARDADAITATTGELITSLRAYADVQPELAKWVEESTVQRRLLVQ